MTFNDVIKKIIKNFFLVLKIEFIFGKTIMVRASKEKYGDGVMILQRSRDKEHSQKYFNLLIFKDTSRNLNM